MTAACTDVIEQSRPEREDRFTAPTDPQNRAEPLIDRSNIGAEQRRASAILRPGDDRFIAGEGQRPRARSPMTTLLPGGDISLNLVDASIPEAANAVLGDALGLNYVIEGSVTGQITLQTSKPLGRDALLEAFQTALEFNGATLAESGNLVTIASISRTAPKFVTLGEARVPGRQIVVVPLEFISTSEMVRLLEPIVANDAILRVSEQRNLLMISGSRREVEAILEAVNLFDVDVLRGKSVAIFRLRAANPEDVANELALLFDTTEGGTLAGVVDFIPNDRLGSILVISSRRRYLREAQIWIERLDATAGQSKRFSEIYNLQNRTAEDLVPILTQLIDATTLAPTEDDGTLALEPEGEMRIVADNISNAVIVLGTQSEQDEIGKLVRELDATPTQVLLEATIAEVTLNDELDFGVRWFIESGNFTNTFSDLATGAVTATFPGFSFLFNSGDAAVALNALSSITDVKVISSPSVLVLDNREAELRVGDQVPVATESAVAIDDPDAPVVNAISFRDTGVLLKVKPRVSERGRVIMDIEQEVSDVVETTSSGIDSPTISQRFIKTSVVVDSGQTLALGGLIQESDSVLKTQVPLLADIPILGQAFKSKETGQDRSELLILITPRVITNQTEGSQITQEFRERLSAPDQILDGRFTQPRHQVQRLLN